MSSVPICSAHVTSVWWLIPYDDVVFLLLLCLYDDVVFLLLLCLLY